MLTLEQALDSGKKMHELEKEYIRAALIRFKGKKSKVSEVLGISIRQLYEKINYHDLDVFKGNIHRDFDKVFPKEQV